MTPPELNDLQDDLYDEFRRWVDRLPCYVNEGDYEGWVDSCSQTIKDTMVNHVLQSKFKDT